MRDGSLDLTLRAPDDADEHCVGECTESEITDARAQCAAGLDPSPTTPGTDTGACDCHCHGPEEHCLGTCSAEQVAQAKAQCAASDSPTPTRGGAGSTPGANEPQETGAASGLAAPGWIIVLSVVVLIF